MTQSTRNSPTSSPGATWMDKPTPQAVEAERALLGVLLTDPAQLVQLHDLEPEDFYRIEHGALFRLLNVMARSGMPIDLVTVIDEISKGAGGADRYGSAGYVADLPDHAPSTANLSYYATVIREKSTLRKLIKLGVDTVNGAIEQRSSTDIARTILTEVADIGTAARKGRHTMSIAELALEQPDHWADVEAGVAMPPLETGLEQLDMLLSGGLRPGEHVVVAGLTSMGKTAFAGGLAVKWALDDGRRVLYHSGEMPKRWNMTVRMQAIASGLSASHILQGQLDEEEMDHLAAVSRKLDGLFVHDRPSASIDHIAAEARRLWALGGLSAIFVDHLGLVRHRKEHGDNGAQAIGRSTKILVDLAKELNCVVVTLVQLNRAARKNEAARKEADPGKWWTKVGIPRVEQLRDSGEIEEDADVILFPVRAAGYGIEDPLLANRAAIVVPKVRMGVVGVAECRWNGTTAQYHDLRVG